MSNWREEALARIKAADTALRAEIKAAHERMPPGTRIEVRGLSLDLKTERWDGAVIVRRRKSWGSYPPGFHAVMFDDGEKPLCVHEDRFRIKK